MGTNHVNSKIDNYSHSFPWSKTGCGCAGAFGGGCLLPIILMFFIGMGGLLFWPIVSIALGLLGMAIGLIVQNVGKKNEGLLTRAVRKISVPIPIALAIALNIFLLLICLLQGQDFSCHSTYWNNYWNLPMDRSLTYTEPKVDNLIGKYIPTPSTKDFIVEEGGYYSKIESFIELSTNDFFQMVNMPDWWQSDSKHTGRFDSGEGKWELRKSDAVWVLSLDFESRTNFAIPHEAGMCLLSVSLQNQAPPYAIRFDVEGNPDSFATLVFEQVVETSER